MTGAALVLVALGFGLTSTVSAQRDGARNNDRVVRTAPMHNRGGGEQLNAVATVLGMTSEEVKNQIRAGKSLADIATSKGVEVQKVIDAVVVNMTVKITEKVTSGILTQAQADMIVSKLTDRVTAMVNGERPPQAGPAMRGGKHGGQGHFKRGNAGTTTGFPRAGA